MSKVEMRRSGAEMRRSGAQAADDLVRFVAEKNWSEVRRIPREKDSRRNAGDMLEWLLFPIWLGLPCRVKLRGSCGVTPHWPAAEPRELRQVVRAGETMSALSRRGELPLGMWRADRIKGVIIAAEAAAAPDVPDSLWYLPFPAHLPCPQGSTLIPTTSCAGATRISKPPAWRCSRHGCSSSPATCARTAVLPLRAVSDGGLVTCAMLKICLISVSVGGTNLVEGFGVGRGSTLHPSALASQPQYLHIKPYTPKLQP